MKKSLLALAVLGAFAGAAQAQSSVTIYGIVDTGVTYANNVGTGQGKATGSQFAMKSGILQGSRLGFKGVEDLGGGLSAVFQVEAGFDNTNGANSVSGTLFNRKSVVGLSGDFGTVLMGRQTDVLDDIGGLTSVADFGGMTNNVGTGLARLQGQRSNNSIRYNTTNMNGLTGSLYYAIGGEAGSNSNGQAFGAGGMYQNGPLSLGAGYYQSKSGTSNNTTAVALNPAFPDVTVQVTAPAALGANIASGTDAGKTYYAGAGNTQLKTFTLAGAYQLGDAKLYANWSRTQAPAVSNAKSNLFEIGGNYALSPALKLLSSVQYNKLTADGATDANLLQLNLGTDYALSKRTDVYAFLSSLRTSSGFGGNPGIFNANKTGDRQTAVAVGVRHKF